MEIRFLSSFDADRIYNIYCNFFSQMEFPDFYSNFDCAFVVENEHGRIIAVGGLKPICEAVVLTDQNASVRERKDALLKLFEAVKYSAEKLKYQQLHAFAYDEEYIRHLVDRMGFKCIPDNKVLSLDLKHGQKEAAGT